MYAVIFKAVLNPQHIDFDYTSTAQRLRAMAQERYGCLNFVTENEGDQEVSISYWPSLEHIQLWKADPEHQVAQARGKDYWYQSYTVEVVEIEHQFDDGQ